jgi:hypothetical protein
MSAKKWTAKYAFAAVLAAILIISVTFLVNPSLVPKVPATSSFAVMLTDPPNVPPGTTSLNVTYSDISIHLIRDDGSDKWVSIASSGTFDSLTLVNISQTIASTTVPTNSSVDKVEFTLANVQATINGTVYNVQTLTNTIVLQVDAKVNQTISSVLVDLNPTLIQTQSLDSNGNIVYNYVLIPSANAMMMPSPNRDQMHVGFMGDLGPDERMLMTQTGEGFAHNVTVTSATLSVNGDTTSLSVTVENKGDTPLRIFGLTVKGQFNAWQNTNQMPNFAPILAFQINGTSLSPTFGSQMGQDINPMNPLPLNPQFNLTDKMMTPVPIDLQNVPNGGQIPPILGNGTDQQNQMPRIMQPNMPQDPYNGGQLNQPSSPPMGNFDDFNGSAASTYVALQPGQSISFTYSGIISPQQNSNVIAISQAVITPMVGNIYNIEIAGEGFQTYTVTATA